MGEGAKRSFRDSFSKPVVSAAKAVEQDQWLVMEAEDDVCDSGSEMSSFEEDSATSSFTSSSCSDLTEDASSSPPELSNGPLFELSDLMAHLPIKRGLSKFYQGKSQSFTCLSSVSCLEDLAKRETPSRKRMKPSCSPKAIISKKTSRGSAPTLGRRSSFRGSFKPPIPVQRNNFKTNQ